MPPARKLKEDESAHGQGQSSKSESKQPAQQAKNSHSSDVHPPVVRAQQIMPQNDAAIGKAVRKMRELLLLSQQDRGDGRLVIEIPIDNGVASSSVSVILKNVIRL